MDKNRNLYLIAYDVCDERRLSRVCRYLTSYKVAGQKSVCEVWTTPAELAAIRANLESLINPAQDRVHFLALDPRMQPRLFGRARHFNDNHFAIL